MTFELLLDIRKHNGNSTINSRFEKSFLMSCVSSNTECIKD